MSENLRDTLSNLDLSLDDAYCRTPYDIPWWCHFGCVGVGCQGYGNSINNCGGCDCRTNQCNNTTSTISQNCGGWACDNTSNDFDIG